MNHLDDLLVYRVEVPPGAIFPEYCQQPEETTYTVDYVRRDHARRAAFGAMRRAAEVARQKDEYADECKQDRKWETAGALQWEAAAIRAAIRAAIGSDTR